MTRSAFGLRLLAAPALMCLAPSFAPPHGANQSYAPVSLGSIPDIRASLPVAEPLVFMPVGKDKARLLNQAIPFAPSVGPAAHPFRFTGPVEAKERAIDCLASAMWYEAGGDAVGQRSVGQVVLNRVRHPAYPASVCGVVFQGSERSTGCQFTFTCDGALIRRPSEVAFALARAQARAMIDGAVDPSVGLATHYHTDWVHPVWSAALDKIAQVNTHLFFRWKGEWGSASGMRQAPSGIEPAIAALAAISPLHRMAAGSGSAAPQLALDLPDVVADAENPSPLPAQAPLAPPPSPDIHIAVAATDAARTPAFTALDRCGTRAFCKVLGTTDTGSIAFLYVRDQRTGVEKTLWDCTLYPRSSKAQCLEGANRSWLAFDGNMHSGGRGGGVAL